MYIFICVFFEIIMYVLFNNIIIFVFFEIRIYISIILIL